MSLTVRTASFVLEHSTAAARDVKRIAVTTFGRSDFSILQPLCHRLACDERFEVGLWVGGAHFEETSGRTVDEVEASGLPIWARIESGEVERTPLGTALTMADQLGGFASTGASNPPDMVLILGDRYEAVAAGLAMVPLGIPVGHISGGSVTEGAIDDTFRHCLTKIAAVHFCDLPRFARRIHFMGEPTDTIHTTGALGLDALVADAPRPFDALVGAFKLTALRPGYILATLHPETGQPEATAPMAAAWAGALRSSGRQVVFTYPNADPGADSIVDEIEASADGQNSFIVRSFGASWFPTAMAHAGSMVGNSSGGIIEAASLGLPVVDIGDRQKGRDHGPNVIHCGRDQHSIRAAIDQATSTAFAPNAAASNVYGDGRGAERVVHVLGSLDWSEVVRPKRFAEPDLEYTGDFEVAV